MKPSEKVLSSALIQWGWWMTYSLPPVEAVWTAWIPVWGGPAEGRLLPRAANVRHLVTRHYHSRPGSQAQEQGEDTGSTVDVTFDIWPLQSASLQPHLTLFLPAQVVPLALVCLLIGCSLAEAESRLEQHPAVREAVEACLRIWPRLHTPYTSGYRVTWLLLFCNDMYWWL